MNYWYYRIYNTTTNRNAEDSEKLRDQAIKFQARIESTKFSTEIQIMFFDFLTRFKEDADTLSVSEAHVFLILPKLLAGREK